MEFTVAYWHWIVLGVVLVLLEIALPSFTAIWFGAGAILVGLLVWLMPSLSLTAQVIIWAIASGVLTWAWFKFIKPLAVDRTKAGLSRESLIGEVGQVLSMPTEERRGTLRFPAPLLGSDEWMFISSDALAIGDRVRVIDLSGNSLIVAKHQTNPGV